MQTEKQKELILKLRRDLFDNNYPAIFAVDYETLEAAEQDIIDQLERLKEPPLLKCGKNGLFYKGCELVLGVK